MHATARHVGSSALFFRTGSSRFVLTVVVGAVVSLGCATSASGAVARYVRGRTTVDAGGRGAAVRSVGTGPHARLATGWLLGDRVEALGGASAARASAGGTYAAVTSQQAPIVLETSKDGRRVAKVVVFWTAACSGGSYMQGETMRVVTTRPATVRPGPTVLVGGTMGKNGAFRASGVGVSDIPGANARFTEQVVGKLGPRRGAGTYSASVAVKNGAGAVIDHCRTAQLRWTAPAPQSLFYGGSTSEAQPTVLQLTADRRNVKTLRLVWFADCSDGGGVGINDAFDDFPLAGDGSFGDSFTQTYPTDDGGQERYDYEIAGRVGSTSASGTFHVVLTATDPSGAVTATCDSPMLRWSARQ